MLPTIAPKPNEPRAAVVLAPRPLAGVAAVAPAAARGADSAIARTPAPQRSAGITTVPPAATRTADSAVGRALAPRRFAEVKVELPPWHTAADSAVGRALVRRRFRDVALTARGDAGPASARAARPPLGARRVDADSRAGSPTVRALLGEGPRVEMVAVTDPEALAVHEQFIADGLVTELEALARRARRCGHERPSGLENGERFESVPSWLALRGSALALHPLFEPSAPRLAYGFDFGDLLTPRFDGASAVDVLRTLLGPERAGAAIDRVLAFCDTAMSEEARLLMAGSIDGRALRQRALVAARAVLARRGRWSGAPRIAAVDAGTGESVAQIAASLPSCSLRLLGRDPLALAVAQVVLGERVPGAQVRAAAIVARDAPAKLAATAGPGFDVIDLTGALDTLPGDAAADLLRSARRSLRPGGVILASAMLTRRPQQTFFEHVVRWPGVIQRSPEQLARLIEVAGFAREQVSLAIAATAPVHAIAMLDSAR